MSIVQERASDLADAALHYVDAQITATLERLQAFDELRHSLSGVNPDEVDLHIKWLDLLDQTIAKLEAMRDRVQ